MQTKPFGRTFDLAVQSLLLAPTLFVGIYSVAADSSYSLVFAFGLFFVGAWQLLSACCWGFLARYALQRKYFLAAVTYVALLIGMANAASYFNIHLFSNQIIMLSYVVMITGIPSIGAIWYWLQTFRLWNNYTPRSFWDIV